MFTSNYARQKRLTPDLKPIAISRWPPRWYKGPVELDLAPTAAMLSMNREDYDREFGKLLEKLDAREMFDRLGENAVLLCFESPNAWCHRRLVAEWFEAELGIVVPEYGFERVQSLPYRECL